MGNTSDPRAQEADLAEAEVRHPHHCECHNIRNGVPDPEPVRASSTNPNEAEPVPSTHSHALQINLNITKINNLEGMIATGPADHQVQLARDYQACMRLISYTPQFDANISLEDQKFFTECFRWKEQQGVVNGLTDEYDQAVSMLDTETKKLMESCDERLVMPFANIRNIESQRAALGCAEVDAQINMIMEGLEAQQYELWYRGAHCRYLNMRIPQLQQRLENEQKELDILRNKMNSAGGAPSVPGDDIPRPARSASAPPQF